MSKLLLFHQVRKNPEHYRLDGSHQRSRFRARVCPDASDLGHRHAPAPQHHPSSFRQLSLVPSSSPPPLLLLPSCSRSPPRSLGQSCPWGRSPHITVPHTRGPLLSPQGLILLQRLFLNGGEGPGIARPYLRRWCSQCPGDVLYPGRWQ